MQNSIQHIPLYVLYAHTLSLTHPLARTQTHTHTDLLAHIATIQAHSELFLPDARKEKCIQARVSCPFPLSLPLSLLVLFRLLLFSSIGLSLSYSPPLARSHTLLVVLLLSCRCRTWLSLAALTILQPYNMHSRRSVIQSVIYSYTHSPTHDWHSLSHPPTLSHLCLFIHSLQWLRCFAASCFVGRSFWVQLTNVCSWTLSINILTHTHKHTRRNTPIYIHRNMGENASSSCQQRRTQAKMQAKTLAEKAKFSTWPNIMPVPSGRKALQLYGQYTNICIHVCHLYMYVCICLCNSKSCWHALRESSNCYNLYVSISY